MIIKVKHAPYLFFFRLCMAFNIWDFWSMRPKNNHDPQTNSRNIGTNVSRFQSNLTLIFFLDPMPMREQCLENNYCPKSTLIWPLRKNHQFIKIHVFKLKIENGNYFIKNQWDRAKYQWDRATVSRHRIYLFPYTSM